ncbi:MAG: hypothetical protein ACFFCW_22040 [Candidatus Hodarchaeota archaeon]
MWAIGQGVKEAGGSEGRPVIGRIGVQALPRPERVQTSCQAARRERCLQLFSEGVRKKPAEAGYGLSPRKGRGVRVSHAELIR